MNDVQTDKIPKIFISYSWSSKDLVLMLANRLMTHGVDVVLDEWDLKAGQDKNAFMERSVNDPSIDKVLIICDKQYTEKANNRKKGVGSETTIISEKIYGDSEQEKFIPIIIEHDENGNPYMPTYIKSRIYFDLSDENTFEDGYNRLLRNIYEKPLIKKPKLGTKPEWLEEDKINFFPVQDLIKQIKGASNKNKQEILVQKFVSQYIEDMKQYHGKGTMTAKQVFDTFIETKAIRDVFLDFLDVLIETDLDIGNELCTIFEQLYNTLIYAKTYNPNATSSNEYEFDVFKCHIWELFICTIVFLRHYNKYEILNKLLTNTYFIRKNGLDESTIPTNYSRFMHRSRAIEAEYKLTTEKSSKFTLMGDVLCHEREKRPIYTGETISQADLFLYQIFNALNLTVNGYYDDYWFPTCYIYAPESNTDWTKLKSRTHCEKMFALFGVSSIDELKVSVSKCLRDPSMKYNGSFDVAPAILSYISLDEIGSLN